jgi:hypothetical protein
MKFLPYVFSATVLNQFLTVDFCTRLLKEEGEEGKEGFFNSLPENIRTELQYIMDEIELKKKFRPIIENNSQTEKFKMIAKLDKKEKHSLFQYYPKLKEEYQNDIFYTNKILIERVYLPYREDLFDDSQTTFKFIEKQV